jgi:hypothetical protein
MRTATIHSDFNDGFVLLWPLSTGLNHRVVPDGITVQVVNTDLNGLALVKIGSDLFEIRCECVHYSSSNHLN